jgi:hypothetical protein
MLTFNLFSSPSQSLAMKKVLVVLICWQCLLFSFSHTASVVNGEFISLSQLGNNHKNGQQNKEKSQPPSQPLSLSSIESVPSEDSPPDEEVTDKDKSTLLF